MNIVLLLIFLEIKAYLRNWGAVFWTFAYPVTLLVLLSTIFGGQDTVKINLQLANGSQNPQVQLFAESLQDRVDMIEGLELNLVWLESIPTAQASDNTLTLKFTENFGSALAKSAITLSSNSVIDQQSGSFISVIAETAEVFNRHITQGEQLVTMDYSGLAVPQENNYDAYLISGLTALTVVSTAMFGFCTVLVSMRQNGSLKMYQVFPMSKLQFLLGFILSRAVILFVFCLLFFYSANLAYGTGLSFSVAETIKFCGLLLAGIVAFLSAGLLMVSMVKKGSTAVAIINIVNLPILFLSDLFMPVAMMPDFIRVVAEKSPVYLFVNSLRNVGSSVNQELIGITFLSLFIVGMVCLVISAKTFRWRNV